MSESQSQSPSPGPTAGPATPPPDAYCRYTGHRRRHHAGRLIILAVALTGSFAAGGVFLGHLQAQNAEDGPGYMQPYAHYRQMQPAAEPADWFGPDQQQAQGSWMPWRNHFRQPGPPMDPAERLVHARYMFDMALTHVGANADQKTKVLAIFDDTAKTLETLHTRAFTTRIDLAAILTAPQVDHDKLEALRAARVGDIDQASKTITKALGDIGDVLTADQRVKLAMLIEHRPR